MGSLRPGMHFLTARPLLTLVVMALAALAGTAERAAAQGAVKSVHNDWQVRCDTPPGAQGEQCALIQSVTAEDRANVGLTVIVLKTADQKSRLMRVVAPVGVLLPSGLGHKKCGDERPSLLSVRPGDGKENFHEYPGAEQEQTVRVKNVDPARWTESHDRELLSCEGGDVNEVMCTGDRQQGKDDQRFDGQQEEYPPGQPASPPRVFESEDEPRRRHQTDPHVLHVAPHLFGGPDGPELQRVRRHVPNPSSEREHESLGPRASSAQPDVD